MTKEKYRWAVCGCGKSHYGNYKSAHEACDDCKFKMSKRVSDFFSKLNIKEVNK
jgi:hypothetical protein